MFALETSWVGKVAKGTEPEANEPGVEPEVSKPGRVRGSSNKSLPSDAAICKAALVLTWDVGDITEGLVEGDV